MYPAAPTRLGGRPSGIRPQGDRQARMPGLHAAFLLQFSPDSGSFRVSGSSAQVKLVRIPQRVVIQHGGMKIADLSLGPRQNIAGGKKNEGQVFPSDLLNPILNL